MEHRIYTGDAIKGLVVHEPNTFFNPQNGECVLFFPKPEIAEDTPTFIRAKFRDYDMYVGTGLTFENVQQVLPTEEDIEKREIQGGSTVPPWNFATAETAATMAAVIAPALTAKNAAFLGIAYAKPNSIFPHVYADGTVARSRELIVVREDGGKKRLGVGYLAMIYARSLRINNDGTIGGLNTFSLFEDVQTIISEPQTSSDLDVEV